MKRTIFAGATLFVSAFVVAACGSKDPPAQSPTAGYPPGQYGYQDPNAAAQYPQQQPPPGAVGAPPMGAPTPAAAPMPAPGPASPPPAAAAPGAADAATAAAVRLALQPRAATEAKGMKEDGAAIGGMLQEGGELTQEFMLMPGRCYTVLGQGLPPIAELDLSLAAKPLLPALPPAILAADQTTGPSSSIGGGKNCYKNPFPVAAPVILTLKATKGSGPAGAQVYSK